MEWLCSWVRRKMIELMIMLGGKGGELFPSSKRILQTNIITDYPQYGDPTLMAVSSDGLVLAMSNGSVVKIARYVSGAWSVEASIATTYPVSSGNYPSLCFSADGTKLFALTTGDIIVFERSGSTWAMSTIVVGYYSAIKPVSNRNGVAVFYEDYSVGSTLEIYTKPSSSWTVLQTISIPRAAGSAANVSFSVSSNGDYIVTHNAADSTTKVYRTYKWNGSTFATNGDITATTTNGTGGSHSKYTISDDGSTFVATNTPISGSTNAIVAKYSGGSWSQISTPGVVIPSVESYVLNISSDGQFLITKGSYSTFVYRMSSSGLFISKHTLVPSEYSGYLISYPSISPSASDVYTLIAPYGAGPIHLLTNKR